MLNPSSEVINPIYKNQNLSNERNAYRVTALYRDRSERIWVGLQGKGIRVLDASYQEIEAIGPADGLLSAIVSSFIEDSSGQMWITTQNGAARIHPQTYAIDNYQRQHGLISNNHNRDATLRDYDGNLYFGSTDGFTVFHPSQLQKATATAELVVSDLHVNNVRVSEYGGESALAKTMRHTQSLEFNHKDTSFAFDFALLSFRAAKYNRYSYLLDGFDQNWSQPSHSNRASYTNVPAGTYTLRVKGQDNTGRWSSEQAIVGITILPAPWHTWWAYSSYALLLVLAVLGSVHHQRKRLELDKERSLNAELLKLVKLKNTFLANTSHELRTPLNGIIGISEYLVDYSKDTQDPHLESHLSKLNASGKRLLNLINDVLDFRKIRE